VPELPELPMVGDEFAGYRLRSVLGRGGMSVVYQAEHPRLGNVIALKVLAPELATDDAFRSRFLEESRIAASLNHPNVIPIHDTGSQDGLLYIAMRYVPGTDMRQMIKKRGRIPAPTALFLLGQAARALDTAHGKGLVHRDVKPGNLLVERASDNEDPDHVYLTDFGITKYAMSRSGHAEFQRLRAGQHVRRGRLEPHVPAPQDLYGRADEHGHGHRRPGRGPGLLHLQRRPGKLRLDSGRRSSPGLRGRPGARGRVELVGRCPPQHRLCQRADEHVTGR
jgi:serine/threonine protein kinase